LRLKFAKAFAVRFRSVEVLVYRVRVHLKNPDSFGFPIDDLSRCFRTEKFFSQFSRNNDGMPKLSPVPGHNDFLRCVAPAKFPGKLFDNSLLKQRMVHRINKHGG